MCFLKKYYWLHSAGKISGALAYVISKISLLHIKRFCFSWEIEMFRLAVLWVCTAPDSSKQRVQKEFFSGGGSPWLAMYFLSTWLDDLLWRNFLKSPIQKLLTWPWLRPLRKDSLITRLGLHVADPFTKFEVSSVRRCGDLTWGVKF